MCSQACDLHRVAALNHHSYIVCVIPAAWIHVSEDPQHVVPQRLGLEGGRDDDVSALRQQASHEHRPSIDVGGGLNTLLRQDVMHSILPVQLHLEQNLGYLWVLEYWTWSNLYYTIYIYICTTKTILLLYFRGNHSSFDFVALRSRCCISKPANLISENLLIQHNY